MDIPIKKPMTQQEVENWIMLKGQSEERWFKLVITDDEIGQDPTMIALMETVSDMIFLGIQDLPFQEANLPKKTKTAKAVKLEIAK